MKSVEKCKSYFDFYTEISQNPVYLISTVCSANLPFQTWRRRRSTIPRPMRFPWFLLHPAGVSVEHLGFLLWWFVMRVLNLDGVTLHVKSNVWSACLTSSQNRWYVQCSFNVYTNIYDVYFRRYLKHAWMFSIFPEGYYETTLYCTVLLFTSVTYRVYYGIWMINKCVL